MSIFKKSLIISSLLLLSASASFAMDVESESKKGKAIPRQPKLLLTAPLDYKKHAGDFNLFKFKLKKSAAPVVEIIIPESHFQSHTVHLIAKADQTSSKVELAKEQTYKYLDAEDIPDAHRPFVFNCYDISEDQDIDLSKLTGEISVSVSHERGPIINGKPAEYPLKVELTQSARANSSSQKAIWIMMDKDISTANIIVDSLDSQSL